MSELKRWDIINWFIREFGYRSYLEIGCRRDDCFRRVEGIQAGCKIGVDPREGGTHRMTSDEFFAKCDAAKNWRYIFDIVFIDGLHHATQVLRDVENSLRYLSTNGVILIHDCLPETEESTRTVDADGNPILSPPDGKPWHGDVWKAMLDIRMAWGIDAVTIDEDHGIGVVIPDRKFGVDFPMSIQCPKDKTWGFYKAIRKPESNWLGVVDWNEARDFARRRLLAKNEAAGKVAASR